MHIRTAWLTLAVGLSLLATGCADGVLRLTFVTATPAVAAPVPTPVTDPNIVIDAQVVPTTAVAIPPSPTAVAQIEATPGSVVIIEPDPAPTATPVPTIGIVAVVVNPPTPTASPPPAPITSVSIIPFEVDVTAGESLQLIAGGMNDAGVWITDADISWSVAEVAGSIGEFGLFTAGPKPGVYPDALTVDLLRGGVITRVTHTITVNAGLVHHWSGDGDANDSVSDNNGATNNGATFAPGLFGEAFSLDGVDDFVLLDHPPAVDDAFTISVWIDLDEPTFDQGQAIFNSDKFFLLKIQSSEDNKFEFGSPGNIMASSGAASARWTHVAATWDGSRSRVYIDGKLDATASAFRDGSPFGIPAQIGRGERGGGVADSPFSGLIDELTIYKRALSADEITALFNLSVTIPAVSSS